MTNVQALPGLEHLCSKCVHKGTYSVRGQCFNCGSEYRLVLTKGHEKPGAILGAQCPACGCRRVAGHELLGAA